MSRRFTSLSIEMRREAEGRSDQEGSPADPVRPNRFRWGYISLDAKYTGECEECEGEIKVGESCWWHPTTRAVRCRDWFCRPTHQTFEDNEIVVWHIRVGQYEPWYVA